MKIKQLEWEMFPKDPNVLAKAECIYGTYYICDDTDDFTGMYCNLVTLRDTKWWSFCKPESFEIFSCSHHDPEEFEEHLFPLVQKDFENRILNCME